MGPPFFRFVGVIQQLWVNLRNLFKKCLDGCVDCDWLAADLISSHPIQKDVERDGNIFHKLLSLSSRSHFIRSGVVLKDILDRDILAIRKLPQLLMYNARHTIY